MFQSPTFCKWKLYHKNRHSPFFTSFDSNNDSKSWQPWAVSNKVQVKGLRTYIVRMLKKCQKIVHAHFYPQTHTYKILYIFAKLSPQICSVWMVCGCYTYIRITYGCACVRIFTFTHTHPHTYTDKNRCAEPLISFPNGFLWFFHAHIYYFLLLWVKNNTWFFFFFLKSIF